MAIKSLRQRDKDKDKEEGKEKSRVHSYRILHGQFLAILCDVASNNSHLGAYGYLLLAETLK